MQWRYEKLDENYKMQYCPANDPDGSVTGHIVIGVKVWFDENPEERKRLGWVKHYFYADHKEFDADYPDYNPATQLAIVSTQVIDEWTIKDKYTIINKTEEMMELEEMLEKLNLYVPSGLVQLDGHGGVLV